jgi:hypothetical protein
MINNKITEIDNNQKNELALLELLRSNKKIINNIKLSLAIFEKLNNFTHNNIEGILKNEILQDSKQ